tara:strand:+ start:250 stop:441 length:192 start_codon:yes stop_codon:yes gene_type:complete
MSIRIILELMIKFIFPIVVFIAAVYGISYFWTNSNSKGKKMIALGLIIALIVGLSLTIYLIFD